MISPVVVLGLLSAGASAVQDWTGWGSGPLNNRWAETNLRFNTASISSIQPHCRLDYRYGASATPVTVSAENTVYFTTWNGSFVSLDYTTCAIKWQINVTDLIVKFAPLNDLQQPGLLVDPVSRTSPQIDGNILYFGTVTHALLVAVDRTVGKVLGLTQINSHPVACITQSPTLYNGNILVGSSSQEESAVLLGQNYQCCSFIGNFMSLKFNRLTNKFTVNWDIQMLPANQGWAGAAVWGSQPSIDVLRNQVYFGTGNLYKDPPAYESCENKSASCLPSDIRMDAIIAADITTGQVNWQNRPTPLDVWQLACGVPGVFPNVPALCPNQVGSDANFGMAPAFVPSTLSKLLRDVVVAGQKNGVLYSFAPETGNILWQTQTNPGSIFGGLSWGVAVDHDNVYFTGMNSLNGVFQLQPSGKTINNSCFGAADLRTGQILWETQSPHNSIALVPPTVVGDLILVGRTGSEDNPFNFENTPGGLIGLNKNTGAIVLDMTLDANFHGGIAVVDKYAMFGTGYAPFMGYTGNGSFYVMKLP